MAMKRLLLFAVLMMFFTNCGKSNKKLDPSLDREHGVDMPKDTVKEMKWEDIKLHGAYEGDNPVKAKIDDVNGVLALYLTKNKKTYKVTFMSSEKVNKIN